jgi:hypothetical protein
MSPPMDYRASIGHCTIAGSPVTVARIEESHAIYPEGPPVVPCISIAASKRCRICHYSNCHRDKPGQ